MIVTIADQYIAQNAGRRYPLADDTDTALPDNAILDFRCTVMLGAETGKVVKAVLGDIVPSASLTDISVTVYSGDVAITTLQFSIPRYFGGGAYTAADYSNSKYCRARITVGSALTEIRDRINPNVQFAASTIIASPMHVDSITSAGSIEDEGSEPGHEHDHAVTLTGDIVLAEGYNAEPYLNGNDLHVDIAKGNGIGEWCQAPEASQTCSNVMFSINGERPGSSGEIKLSGKSGIVVKPHPDDNELEITIDSTASETVTEECDPKC